MASLCVKRTLTSFGLNKKQCWTLKSLSSVTNQPATNVSNSEIKEASTAIVEKLNEIQEIQKERFIPLTTKTLLRYIIQEKNLINPNDSKKFQHLAVTLDNTIIKKYNNILHEMKTLFEPLNPDNEVENRLGRREKLDNEFWLLEKLSKIMELANFEELSKENITEKLGEHVSKHRLLVSIKTDRYDVLRVWTLVHQKTAQCSKSWYDNFLAVMLKRFSAKPTSDFYRRVVIALRLKTEDKLMLKAYREVPVTSLELLLPDGTIKMAKMESNLLAVSGATSLFGIVAEAIAHSLHYHPLWPLGVTGLSLIGAAGLWASHLTRQRAYLRDHLRTLHYKNITNNHTLLELLVRRAEDEILKQCLLVFVFLSQLMSSKSSAKLSAIEIEESIEAWLLSRTGRMVEFESIEAIKLLTELGLVTDHAEKGLQATSLDSAINSLPITLSSLLERDVIEGFDVEDIKNVNYTKEKILKKEKKFGIF